MSDKKFIDLFAGCGGLSLGLRRAGWKSLFAVEANPDAFLTYSKNHLKDASDWPDWLPQVAHRIEDVLGNYRTELAALKGSVQLVAGGPPCQGFSMAGRRRANDPRNQAVNHYLEFLKLVEPQMVLLENVRGFMTMRHERDDTYSQYAKIELEKLGYEVDSKLLIASDWGVPQRRPRFFIVAWKSNGDTEQDPFADLELQRESFLLARKLPTKRAVTVGEAIGDLTISTATLIDNLDGGVGGFKQIDYKPPKKKTGYLAQMRKGAQGSLSDLRLPKHSDVVRQRFADILASCRPGYPLTVEDRKRYNMQKRSLIPLSAEMSSRTITTLPDDMIHYSEPRILTVRECARLQSFPDSFKFYGPYTTGGDRRQYSCPRYTQVGNAVPPLLAEALGEMLMELS